MAISINGMTVFSADIPYILINGEFPKKKLSLISEKNDCKFYKVNALPTKVLGNMLYADYLLKINNKFYQFIIFNPRDILDIDSAIKTIIKKRLSGGREILRGVWNNHMFYHVIKTCFKNLMIILKG